jgi:hypothetical protein
MFPVSFFQVRVTDLDAMELNQIILKNTAISLDL